MPVTQEGQDPTLLFLGDWEGDVATRIPHGPVTDATDLEYQTRTERKAYAAYTQGVFNISDKWDVTFGVRWAEDNLDGEENLFRYSENIAPLPGIALLNFNILNGSILGTPGDPTDLATTPPVARSGCQWPTPVFTDGSRQYPDGRAACEPYGVSSG